MSRQRWCAIVVVAACLLCPASLWAGVDLKPIVLAGDPATGVAGGEFAGCYDASISNSGTIAFYAKLVRAGDITTANDTGIWMGTASGVDLLLREDDSVPGQTGDVRFSGVYGSVNISDDHGVAFRGKLKGDDVSSSSDYAQWAGGMGTLTVAAREGSPAAGLPTGVMYTDIYQQPSYSNGSSRIAFTSGLTGSGVGTTNNAGMWVGTPGSLQLVMRKGDQAAGQAANVDYSAASPMPFVNDLGEVAFKANLTGAISSDQDTAVYVGAPGALQVVAQEGFGAPGTSTQFSSLDNPTVNNTGAVLFEAGLVDNDADPNNDRGLWSGRAGSLSLAVRAGDDAPGLPGVRFGSSFLDPILMNGAGEICFRSNLVGDGVTTDNDYALWYGTPGNLQMVVREGDAMPDSPGYHFDASFIPVINKGGQMVFMASPVESMFIDSVWAWAGSTVMPVAMEGQMLEVGVGDTRQINGVSMLISYPSAGEDGWARALNDHGQFVVNLDFADGSAGLFLGEGIPEPATLAILAIGGITLLGRRRS